MDIVLHADELGGNRLACHLEEDVTRPPITVLGAPDAAGVEEVDAVNLSMPWQMRVTESDGISRLRGGDSRHIPAEVIGPILSPVDGIQRRRSVHKNHLGA